MTAPTALLPTCILFIDGTRMNDGQPSEDDLDPVALTDLRVTWGRSNTLDQPSPATCTFSVMDLAGGQRFLSRMRLGSKVQVRAEATIFPDPTTSIVADAGFEGLAIGAVPSVRTSNATAVIANTKVHNGSRAARVIPTNAGSGATVVFPPKPFSTNASAWDAVPRSAGGQTWGFGASVNIPVMLGSKAVFDVRPVYFTSPVAGAYTIGPEKATKPAPDANGWVVATGKVVPPSDVWVGIAVTLFPTGPAWNDVPAGVTWNSLPSTGLAWQDTGFTYVDDLLVTVPEAGALRSAVVFDGRITDLEARYELDVGGTVVDVIAQDDLAELGNRYVGSTPYPQESLATRFGKIVSDSGQTLSYTVDSAVQGIQVSYQDVDNQPATQLLQRLATSVAGVLWSATSTATGPFLRLEDINSRPAMMKLVMDPPKVQNLFTQPSFENNSTAGWSLTNGTLSIGGTATPAVPGRSGTKCLRVSVTTAATLVNIWTLAALQVPITVGKLYRYAVYTRTGSASSTGSSQLFAEYRNASDVIVGGQVSSAVTPHPAANGWARMELTMPAAPATAVKLFLYLRAPGAGLTAGYLIDFDAITVHEVTATGDATLPFFDGDTPADATTTYAWDGTALASSSTRLGQYHVETQPVVAASGITLDACIPLLEPVRWQQDSQDASTRVVVTWLEQTANPTPPPAVKPTSRELSVIDAPLEAATGQRRVGVSTVLALQADAQKTADALLARLQVPGWRITGLVIDLSLETIDSIMLGTVMRVLDGATRLGLPILLVNLPDWNPSGNTNDQALYLEGGRFSYDQAWRLELLVSSASAQGKSILRWIDVPAGITWNNMGTVTWGQLTGVGPP